MTTRDGVKYSDELDLRVFVGTKRFVVRRPSIRFTDSLARLSRKNNDFAFIRVVGPNVGKQIDVMGFKDTMRKQTRKSACHYRSTGETENIDFVSILIVGANIDIEVCNNFVDSVGEGPSAQLVQSLGRAKSSHIVDY